MKFKTIEDKEKFFKENYPFSSRPKLTDKKHCIHCDKDIIVGDFKVLQKYGETYILCPNSPICNGTVIDWISINK